jgi:putative peptidoglycan lipid II flippase
VLEHSTPRTVESQQTPSEGRALVGTSFLLIGVTVAVKLLGFGRDQFVAYIFGPGQVSDAYYLTLTFVIGLLAVIGGTFSTALVPSLTAFWSTAPAAGWRTTRAVGVGYVWIIGGVAAVIIIFAPWLVGHVLGPGLPARSASLAAGFLRAFSVGFLFWGAASALAGILNSRKEFLVAACGPVALNGAILLVLLAGVRHLGVAALAAATVAGMFAQFLLLAPFAVRAWLRDRAAAPPAAAAVRDGSDRVWALIKPVFTISLLSQVPSIVDKVVASGLPVGSVSVLAFAQKLMQLPLGLFVGGVATVFYTSLSHAWARRDPEKAADELALGLGVTLMVAIPAAVGLAALSRPIVQFVFQHGRFDAAASGLTSHVLLYYCVGLPLIGANLVLMRNAFAGDDAGAPLKGYVAAFLVNGLGDVVLSRLMGPAGIALASSLGAITLASFLVASWPGPFRANVFRASAHSLARVLAATAGMTAVVLALSAVLAHRAFWVRLSVPGVAGLAVYAICLLIFPSREVRHLVASIRRKGAASRLLPAAGDRDPDLLLPQ